MNHLVEASEAADAVRSTGSSESEAGPRTSSSGLPISFVWHSEQEQRSVNLRWAVSTLVMVLAVSLAAWVGAAVSNAPPAPAAAPPPVSSAVLQARPVDTYAVEVRTYPPDAALEIDGLAVGAGHWFARYTKDSATHELRITAPGYIPARILFVDTPPPLQVRLDPLLAPPATPPTPSAASEVSAAERDVSSSARAERQRKKPGPQRRRPYVQIIDGDAPSVPAE
jgi:hypothetical protein